MTPVFDLSGVDGASVSYWVWYTNSLGNNPNQDYWDVQVTSDGTNWVNLEHTTNSTNAWAQRTFNLQDYITLSQNVRLRFVAQDTGSASLVEALIDDFILLVQEAPPAAAFEPKADLSLRLQEPSPNPGRGGSAIRFRVGERTDLRIQLFDAQGALVRTLIDGPVAPGAYRLDWDGRSASGHPVGTGVYFVRLRASGVDQVKELVLLR